MNESQASTGGGAMTMVRAVVPAYWTLGTAVFLLMLSSMPVAAQSPEGGQAVPAIHPSPVADIAVPADALRTLRVRLVTAILVALSGASAPSGSQAVRWSQARAGAGSSNVTERGESRRPASPTALPQIMTANSAR